MKRTPLYEVHCELGAKIVHFSGWEMPLSYTGVTDEHRCVRSAAGLFDVSHMGRFELKGEGADALLSRITPVAIHRLSRGGAQYALLLNDKGGIIDDIYVYKKAENDYLLVVNASNRLKALRWIKKQRIGNSPRIEDLTESTALIALQGPKSWDILSQVIPSREKEIPLRRFIEIETPVAAGATLLIARTGYTGEKGYEVVIPAAHAQAIWQSIMRKGVDFGIKAAGLGARDTLRLELGYPLYGHEMDEETTPLEADLTRFVDFEKDFVGKEKLVEQQAQGFPRKLVGFELLDRGVPREGLLIYSEQKEIGKVSSGNYSPSLRKGIGMAYIDRRHSEEGSELLIDIRGKGVLAVVVKKPFYRKKRDA